MLAPVEVHLEGDTEVLIIPHKELFEMQWAALFDTKTGQYLIQRYVLRVAPSLLVARSATYKMWNMKGPEEKGHALVVGNPLPTREEPLCEAEAEADFVSKLLREVGFEVHTLMWQAASKAQVQNKIEVEGAKWHLACHGDLDKNSLMLAEKAKTVSSGKKHKPKKGQKKTSVTGLEGERGVREMRRRRRRRRSTAPRLTMCRSKGFHQRRTSRWRRCRGACVWGWDLQWC